MTPKAPTDEPVKIKIISNSNNDVFAYLEVNVLDFRESDIDISYSKPLEQTIGSLEDIVFTVSGLNGHSCKWYVDGVLQGITILNSHTALTMWNTHGKLWSES